MSILTAHMATDVIRTLLTCVILVYREPQASAETAHKSRLLDVREKSPYVAELVSYDNLLSSTATDEFARCF